MDKIWGKSIMTAKNRCRCNNKCKFFEDKPGQLQPQKVQSGDWIGWCHLRGGNLLILNSTYDLICYFGCASHSVFQPERDKVEVPLKALKSVIGLAFSFPQLPEEVRNQLIEVDNFYHKAKDEADPGRRLVSE
jgi:hypothetical protein